MTTQGKRLKAWPPQLVTPVPAADLKRSRGIQVIDFAEALCKITKDSVAGGAGEPMIFRPWQKSLTNALFAVKADGTLRHRTALIGLPRKNGKSAWLSAVALEQLVFGVQGGEIYSCAADREQARIVFGTAKRMIEMQPELAGILEVYRDTIYNPQTGSSYRALSSEAYSKEGLSPTFVAFDEVHAQPTRELWDVMQLASGARREPMMVGITTAGLKTQTNGQDSLAYSMYQYGSKVASGEVVDPSFFFAWWQPSSVEADYRDEQTWREANPGFDDIVSKADFDSVVNRTPESEFRTKRCNQWVSVSNTWLPSGSWESCTSPRVIPDGTDIVLAFDGSHRFDATAIVGVTVEEKPHVFVVDVWERPKDADNSWQVPVKDVEESIRAACRKWQVLEVTADPFRWVKSLQELDDEGLPVVEFPQHAARMTPATNRFTEAVLNKALTHDGDPRMARHIGNAVLKVDARGSRIAKESKSSSRSVDLAMSSVMGVERAAFWFGRSAGLPMIFDVWSLGDENE
jgi:phage terminase large subunit-like protein